MTKYIQLNDILKQRTETGHRIYDLRKKFKKSQTAYHPFI